MGLSTHILNTASGRPAQGVAIALSRLDGSEWMHLNEADTDADGRCKTIFPAETPFTAATYRLRFETAAYFRAQGTPGLYPYVEIVFTVEDAAQHYHIPLLLTPNGYTTYRGS
jgi:5-hydroxyisourate hydrolase